MTQWRYYNEEQTVVFRIWEDGTYESRMASTMREGEEILPFQQLTGV